MESSEVGSYLRLLQSMDGNGKGKDEVCIATQVLFSLEFKFSIYTHILQD